MIKVSVSAARSRTDATLQEDIYKSYGVMRGLSTLDSTILYLYVRYIHVILNSVPHGGGTLAKQTTCPPCSVSKLCGHRG